MLTNAMVSRRETSKLVEVTPCKESTIARDAVKMDKAEVHDWEPGLAKGSCR